MNHRDSHRALPTLALAGTGLANIGPTRSRTDPPAQQRPEKSHLHRRLHSNTIGGKASHGPSHHRHRDRAIETVQSAIELKPPISFEHLLRRDKKSPESSRRHSGSEKQQSDADQWRAEQQRIAEKEARRKVKPADVEKLRAENAKREEELRTSLKSVEEIGMSSTRELDDTYYSILEKASILRATVVSLQHLAEESQRMHMSFQDDTKVLTEETTTNIEAFGNFEEQEKNINGLVEKLQRSKGVTDKLNERLEAARGRVEAYESRRNARQAKRRKQWSATGGMLVAVLVLILAIVLLKRHRYVTSQMSGAGRTIVSVGNVMGDAASKIPAMLRPAPSPSEDPYLQKLFDDL